MRARPQGQGARGRCSATPVAIWRPSRPPPLHPLQTGCDTVSKHLEESKWTALSTSLEHDRPMFPTNAFESKESCDGGCCTRIRMVHYPSCARSRRRPVHGWRRPDGADRLWSGVRRAPDDPLLHHADAHSETGSGRALALQGTSSARAGAAGRVKVGPSRAVQRGGAMPNRRCSPSRCFLVCSQWSCGSLRLHLRGFVFGSLSVGLRQLHWWPPHCDTGPPPPAPTRPHAAPTAVASRAGPPLHTQPSLCPRLVLALVACRVRAPRLGWTRVRRASPPARLPRRAPLLARARPAAIAAHAFGRIATQAVEG